MTQPGSDFKQTVVNAFWNAQLDAALEEKKCLQKKADQDTQEDKIIGDRTDSKTEKAELAAVFARVEQLRAQKAKRNVYCNAILRQPHSETTRSVSQGESFFVSKELVLVELFSQYLAIDNVHLKAIKENKSKLINLFKLTTKMTLDRNKVKVLTVESV